MKQFSEYLSSSKEFLNFNFKFMASCSFLNILRICIMLLHFHYESIYEDFVSAIGFWKE